MTANGSVQVGGAITDIPAGPALVGYSITVQPQLFTEATTCSLRADAFTTYLTSAPTVVTGATTTTIAMSGVVQLPAESDLQLECTTIFFSGWSYSSQSIYAISFAP
jgi:hypothetical protein